MPARSSASMRTEASTLKPPEPCPTHLRRVPRHAGGVELVEESLAPEVAEDALLDDRLHVGDAIGRQVNDIRQAFSPPAHLRFRRRTLWLPQHVCRMIKAAVKRW